MFTNKSSTDSNSSTRKHQGGSGWFWISNNWLC
jgi:hypothetical protein